MPVTGQDWRCLTLPDHTIVLLCVYGGSSSFLSVCWLFLFLILLLCLFCLFIYSDHPVGLGNTTFFLYIIGAVDDVIMVELLCFQFYMIYFRLIKKRYKHSRYLFFKFEFKKNRMQEVT